MTRLESGIKNVFVKKGIMLENWKLKVTSIDGQSHSDYRDVTVEVLKPRCKKPCITWILNINMARELINFEKSSFYR